MSRVPPITSNSAREAHSAEMPITQPKDIVSTGAEPLNRGPDVIVATDSVFKDGYVDELAFMEEPVTIILQRRREKFAPLMYDFSVNGRPIWLRVDQPTVISRKYLEVIARSQPYDVQTEVRKNEDQGENAAVQNIVQRHQSQAYPFVVIEDKNPRGPAWLAKVMRES